MATVIGVRFKKAGKVYYFDPDGIWPRPGDNVIVETTRGVEYGEVVTGSRTVSDAQIVTPLKKVVRIATEEDTRRAEANEALEKEAFAVCQDRIARHKLDMKLVSVEYTFDNSKIIFYFTANGRVDFRELVKDLASVFRIRIELRQIGVRDEAKMLGGLGSCGRQICCGAFLGDFQPVSIKMAKEQGLSLNPVKISGQCGRLMCCLKYEQDNYDAVLKRLPRVGKDIVTPDGVGVITEINVIKERVKVRIHVDDDSFDVREYAIDDVRRPGPDDAAAIREMAKPQDRRSRRPRPQDAAEESPEGGQEEGGEDARKKRYPHQKAPKNLSTDQFFEKLKENGGVTPVANKEHKRRRGKGGKGELAGEEGREDLPTDAQRPERPRRRPETARGEEDARPAEAVKGGEDARPVETVKGGEDARSVEAVGSEAVPERVNAPAVEAAPSPVEAPGSDGAGERAEPVRPEAAPESADAVTEG